MLASIALLVGVLPSAAFAEWDETAPSPTPLDFSQYLAIESDGAGGAVVVGFHSGRYRSLDAGESYRVFIEHRDASGEVVNVEHLDAGVGCRNQADVARSASRNAWSVFIVRTCDGFFLVSVDAGSVESYRPLSEPDDSAAVSPYDVQLGIRSDGVLDVIGSGALLGTGGGFELTVHQLDTALDVTASLPVPFGVSTPIEQVNAGGYVTTARGVGWFVASAPGALPHLPPVRALVRVSGGVSVVRSVGSACSDFPVRVLGVTVDDLMIATCGLFEFDGSTERRAAIEVADATTGAVRQPASIDEELYFEGNELFFDDAVSFGQWDPGFGAVLVHGQAAFTNGSIDPAAWTVAARPEDCFSEDCAYSIFRDLAVVEGGIALVGASVGATGSGSSAEIKRLVEPDLNPVTMARVLDTRDGELTIDGAGEGGGPTDAGAVTVLQLGGRGGVPAGADGVMVNIAAVRPDRPGFVTAFACDTDRPNASSLNHGLGGVTSNSVTVPLSADGRLCLFTSAATHLVVDVSAWYRGSDRFGTIVPARMIDTRPGRTTVDSVSAGGGQIVPGGVRTVRIAGRAGVPDNAAGVIANVTAIRPDVAGFVSVHRCGDTSGTSTVNVGPNEVRGNSTFVALDGDGSLCVTSSTAVDVTIDVVAWFGADSAIDSSFAPRVVDTREGEATYDGRDAGTGRPSGDFPGYGFPLRTRDGFGSARTVVLSVIVVRPDGPGFATAYPCIGSPPLAATVNFGSAGATANTVAISLDPGSGGDVCIELSTPADLVVDVIAVA